MKSTTCSTLIRTFTLTFYLLFNHCLMSQNDFFNELNGNEINYDYSDRPRYSMKDAKNYVPSDYLDHPEIGTLPFDKPEDKNVVEDLSKRTEFKRYYVDLDNPAYFYIQKSATPLNYKSDGNWLAISPFLEKESTDLYRARNQAYPTELSLSAKNTGILINNSEIKFNNYSIKVVNDDGSTEVYDANWSDIKVGNKAAYITDVFPGIDMRILFKKGAIKSDFILNQETVFKSIQFTDQYDMPNNLEFVDTSLTGNTPFLLLRDLSSELDYAKIGKVKSFDASGNKQGWIHEYMVDENLLSFELDSSFLHNDSINYPLTIDPLIIAVGPVNSGFGVSGSLEAPAECSNNLAVNFPGGSTPWDVSATWEVFTNQCYYDAYYGFYYPCWNADAQITLESSCGGFSPTVGNSWQCIGCNTPGTWTPALPFNSAGTQSLAQCYSPSCAAQTLNFNINISRASNCPQLFGVYDNCNWGNSLCVSLDTWSVTVQGRTLETLGDNATGSGSTTIIASSCSGGTATNLDPTPEYGVPNYTYNWSTGETTPTINISNFNTGDVFTANVTDACGNTETATFEVNCPLAVTLEEFYVENLPNEVRLDWTTVSERNNDYFEVLRSTDSGESFEKIGVMGGAGDSNEEIGYIFFDENPVNGVAYYQLGIVDTDGKIEYSSIQSVNRFEGEGTIVCIPNPADDRVDVAFNYPESGMYSISLVSMMGQEVVKLKSKMEKGQQTTTINTSNLKSGVYQVQIQTKKHVHTTKLVIK